MVGKILFVIFLLFLIFVLMIKIITTIINEIKSAKFLKTNAKVIDKVVKYSEEWGKYFPEIYQKKLEFQKKCDDLVEFGEKISTVRNSIPISVKNKTILIKFNKNSNNEEINFNEETDEISYVFIYEYNIDNKVYYIDVGCENKDSLKRNLGKTLLIKVNPKNPKFVVIPKTWLSSILFCIFLQAIFIGIIYLVFSS